MTENKIWASIRMTFEQFHRWIDAPEQVHYLRNLHRHLFYLQVDIQQFGDDRDIEYFIFADQVKKLSKEYVWHENTSCEMFSIDLKKRLESKYNGRQIRVSLYEDNENGCIIE